MLCGMAGIDLATAETNLQRWLDAQATVVLGRTTTIGDRTLTQHDLTAIESMIDYWDRKCRALSRGGGVVAQRMTVND